MKKIGILLIVLMLLSGVKSCAEEFSEKSVYINFNEMLPSELHGKIEFTEEDTYESKANKASESLNLNSIWETVSENLKNTFTDSISVFSGIFAIIIISSLISAFKENFKSSSILCEYICVLGLSWYLFCLISPMIDNLKEILSNLCDFAINLFPSMLMLSTIGGEITGATIGGSTVMLIINVLQSISVYILYPLIKIIFVFSIMSSVCESVNFRGITNFLKNFCVYGVGILMTIFTAVLFLQKSVSQSADSLNMKISKFAVSSVIPIVGSMVAESLRTVIASVGLIKNITGVLGISMIIYFIIPPICAVLIYKIIILFCALTSKAIGLNKQSELFYEINSILNIINSILLCVCVTFIVSIGIFMSSMNV